MIDFDTMGSLLNRVKLLEDLLQEASTCIYGHHGNLYKLEWGAVCQVCCPDGNPYNSIITRIDEALKK